MTRPKIRNLAVVSSLALFGILAVASVLQAAPNPAAGTSMTQGQMQEHCNKMMEHKKTMAAETKTQDAALTELVAKMNGASGTDQIPLMAAAITRMAEQRVAHNAHMASMDDERMGHMMQHMQSGKDSMGQCPMMKGMKDTKSTAGMKHKDDN